MSGMVNSPDFMKFILLPAQIPKLLRNNRTTAHFLTQAFCPDVFGVFKHKTCHFSHPLPFFALSFCMFRLKNYLQRHPSFLISESENCSGEALPPPAPHLHVKRECKAAVCLAVKSHINAHWICHGGISSHQLLTKSG